MIEEWLRQHGALSENLAICSNRLNYDAVTLTLALTLTLTLTLTTTR